MKKAAATWGTFVFMAGLSPAFAQTGAYNPAADPRSVVAIGRVRFTVLTPQMIRMEWAADGGFEDRPSLVFLHRRLPVVAFTRDVRPADGGVVILTSMLRLEYKPAKAGDKFDAENLSIALLGSRPATAWKPGMNDTGNLFGTTRGLDGTRGSNAKLEPGLVSRDGWTVVDDSARPLFDGDGFPFTRGEHSPWPWVVERAQGDRQDWYFFGYGHNYKQALHDFTLVAGKIPLPPRFAFGTWWSRYWAYSDRELVELVRGFETHNVPLDVLVIDMDWHNTFGSPRDKKDAAGQRLGWTGYSWNRSLFPDPDKFLKWVREQGLKTTLNLHPESGVQPWEDRYPEMARAMGVDPATKQYVPFDIWDKKYATNYMNILHHPLERQGIDFWWLDLGRQIRPKKGVNPTWWLGYVHFTDQEREGKRPLILNRWGGLGNHRYQIGFSGDTTSSWETLAFQPYFTATAANVGYAYWSHDIGGHLPGVVEPELYTRWLQFGAFSPILRTHAAQNPDAERRIWAYPEPYADVMREAFVLRQALLPYVYTEARRTYDSGVAFLRPLYYDWPDADEAYGAKNEYLFGDNLIVAPVVQAVDPKSGLVEEKLWLPTGNWIEWPTGAHITGPKTIARKFSISQIPVYVKSGSIVPMQPEMRYSNERPVDPLIVNVFTLEDGQTSWYRLYEDAGTALDYKRDQCAWTELRARRLGNTLSVEIGRGQGRFDGMPAARGYEIRLPGDWPPESVTVNGKPAAWRFEGGTLSTVIRVASIPVSQAVRVEVKTLAALQPRRGDLAGVAGALVRLREAYDSLNRMGSGGWSPDELVEAMQTGTRLSYRPEEAGPEVEQFRQRMAKLPAVIEALRATGGQAAAQWRNEMIDRALAQVADAIEVAG